MRKAVELAVIGLVACAITSVAQESIPVRDLEEASAAVGSRAEFDLSVGLGAMAGHTLYQIGGTIIERDGRTEAHFPISELEFPLDVAILSMGGAARINERLDLSFRTIVNISDDPGNMIDKDWIEPGRLDIYSESESELDSYQVDFKALYYFINQRGIELGIGGGLLVQNFDYECSLIRQYSPSGLSGLDYVGDGGLDLTYEITYVIPYLEGALQLDMNRHFTMGGAVSVAPWMVASDEDNHLLRDPPIKAEGDYDGYALRVTGDVDWNLGERWFLRGELAYMLIEADGEQDNSVYGRWTHTTDAEVESEQSMLLVETGFRF